MSTGLESFDAFGWDKLLVGREILLVDPDRQRAIATAQACEEAGAKVSIARDELALQQILTKAQTTILVLASGPYEHVAASLAAMPSPPAKIFILGAREDHAAIRTLFPSARILQPDTQQRELVLIIAGQDNIF